MNKHTILLMIVFLLIASSFVGVSNTNELNIDSEAKNRDDCLEKLAFYSNDRTDTSVKYDYYKDYKEQLLAEYPNEDREIVEEHVVQPSELLPTISGGPMDSAWPMQNHDLHHTGRSPYSTANTTGIEKWRFKTDNGILSGSVIDNNGIIYFGGSYNGLPYYLYAIYPNGTMKWRYQTNGLILGSSPAIAEDGTIYVGSWDCRLYAINNDGTEKWAVGTGGSIASSPAIANDGTIYVGNYGSKIVAINPNGTIKWCYGTEDDITSDPAIGDDGTIYIGSLDSYLYALYPNGTLRWSFKTGDRIYGSPSIADDGTIYIGSSWDSYLYALYPNGTMKWKYSNAGTPNNPSNGNDGTIYAGYLYNLIALYPNGTLKWDFYIGDDRYIGKSAPAISADGTIYFGINLGIPGDSDGGELIAVNPNGTEKWRKKIANFEVVSSPSIGEDGTVYVGSYSHENGYPYGYLHAFGIGDFEADADGPYYGITNEPVQFIGTARNGTKPYDWLWDFGDGNTSTERNATHAYTRLGNYTVTLSVNDSENNTANDTTWALIQEENNPPNPPLIEGRAQGKVGVLYEYTFTVTDDDEDDMYLWVEWGDEETDECTLESGEEVKLKHSWSEEGVYTIRARARDVFGAWSNWSSLEVTMPMNQHSNHPLFWWLLERFPLLKQLLWRLI